MTCVHETFVNQLILNLKERVVLKLLSHSEHCGCDGEVLRFENGIKQCRVKGPLPNDGRQPRSHRYHIGPTWTSDKRKRNRNRAECVLVHFVSFWKRKCHVIYRFQFSTIKPFNFRGFIIGLTPLWCWAVCTPDWKHSTNIRSELTQQEFNTNGQIKCWTFVVVVMLGYTNKIEMKFAYCLKIRSSDTSVAVNSDPNLKQTGFYWIYFSSDRKIKLLLFFITCIQLAFYNIQKNTLNFSQ